MGKTNKTKSTKETNKAAKVKDTPVIAKTNQQKKKSGKKCGKKPREMIKAEMETELKKIVIEIKHDYLRTFAIRLYDKN